ncbi:hypothetical protein PHLCEN_2v12488 [Hermanssonia centrifuga]|uniref:Uncharacterized protein n=1 Tax=Hermanssonia centrifuga TaxID=98765 RepID=A0A2R6NGX3_9APHY|nr:hypothetical protein PHLCEN_2v12488 [Hermanssonia centrifuga]
MAKFDISTPIGLNPNAFPPAYMRSSNATRRLFTLALCPAQTLMYHAKTLYLFTKSDIKTIVIPITLFAWLSAPNTSMIQILRASFWTWLQLLHFCVSNQSLSPEEDKQNKPDRPLASGRLGLKQSRILRWLLLPLCVTLSVAFDVPSAGISFAIHTFLYNEMGLNSHWSTRNLLNALGYSSFDAGASVIAQAGGIPRQAASVARQLSFWIVFTTIHAQDFYDEAGDRLDNRRTLPIVMPEVARVSMPIFMTAWSVILGIRWFSSVNALCALCFALFGFGVGLRFYLYRSYQADKFSFLLYMVSTAISKPELDSERESIDMVGNR